MAPTTNVTTTTKAPKVCEKGGSGYVLPMFGQDEQGWPTGLRIVLYFFGLSYFFMGVAIVADIFMGAIECITAKKKRKYHPTLNRFMTVAVWNPTVANLTLMALGSSAPEIMISVIELLGTNFFSGDLGPSTIVGSAAFNLFCIIAVCVIAIPSDSERRIKEMPVYAVTAVFSLFAYFWLVVILQLHTPHVVEIWEGLLTFLFFPILVVLAFLADKGYFSKTPVMGKGIVVSAEMSKEELAEVDARIRRDYGSDLRPDQVAKIALIESDQQKSRAERRVAATRGMFGGKRVKGETRQSMMRNLTGKLGNRVRATLGRGGSTKIVPVDKDEEDSVKPDVTIEFETARHAVLENKEFVRTTVARTGKIDVAVAVDYQTRDGTARSGSDYITASGTLQFGPGETSKNIDVKIVNDNAFEDDEDFFIDLAKPRSHTGEIVVLGEIASATVVIIDDDLAGELSFPKDEIKASDALEDFPLTVSVLRKNGCSGRVTCQYATESATAIETRDFEPAKGTLTFENEEAESSFQVIIKGAGKYERSEYFRIVLSEPTGGVKFDGQTDGGDETCILTIFIETDAAGKERVDRLLSALNVNWDKTKIGSARWKDQFTEALYVNGGDDDDDDDDDDEAGAPSMMDYVMHYITLPWKLLFACIPPTEYCGGWLTFFSALGAIGLVTTFISDLASLLGCSASLPDEVTAITFVALGTSLPDLFASKSAAEGDPYADASIGNVTGSNSVNVFLGLGLPWMIGAIKWPAGGRTSEWDNKYSKDTDIAESFRKDGAFIVKAGNLTFSVTVFVACACAAMGILLVRRYTCRGELGGPAPAKWATFVIMVSLWLLYVSLSAWKTFSTKDD